MMNAKSFRSNHAGARTMAAATPFCTFVLLLMDIVCVAMSVFATVRVSMMISVTLPVLGMLAVIFVNIPLVRKSRACD